MTDFLDRNLSLIENRFPRLIPLLKKSYPPVHLTLKESRSGHPVPQIEEGGRDYPFHSLFDPRKEGEKLLRTYAPEGVKIFLGLGGAYQITPFLNESPLLIIEPDPALLKALFCQMDFTPLLSSPHVTLISGESSTPVSEWLKSTYTPLLDGNLQVIPLRSYRNRESLALFQEGIDRAIKEISADCSTQKKLGRQWQRNILRSFERAATQPFHRDLFKGYDRAIITAAGPSLEKHLPDLKKRSPGTFLLAVDTALPTLIQWGVVPDGVIIIDPQSIGYLHFMEPIPEECRIIADWGTPLPDPYGKRASYIGSYHPLCSYLIAQGSLPLLQVESGGNVTQAALNLMGRGPFTEIALLGADYSYPQGKPYCRGSYITTWYEGKSDRKCPLENHLTRFILDRSTREKESQTLLYRSPLMDSYEQNFLAFVTQAGGRPQKREQGYWTIEFPLTNTLPPKEPVNRNIPSLLSQYKEELEALFKGQDYLPSPLLSTLIPLGYSFLEEDGKEALKKAAGHTLHLLKGILPGSIL
ncbi:MAG: DUF115 domain-containing protein [Spirochaetales bacterium]|nr:DUF115 domain-containing protein [Spirochaetales bacterium]